MKVKQGRLTTETLQFYRMSPSVLDNWITLTQRQLTLARQVNEKRRDGISCYLCSICWNIEHGSEGAYYHAKHVHHFSEEEAGQTISQIWI